MKLRYHIIFDFIILCGIFYLYNCNFILERFLLMSIALINKNIIEYKNILKDKSLNNYENSILDITKYSNIDKKCFTLDDNNSVFDNSKINNSSFFSFTNILIEQCFPYHKEAQAVLRDIDKSTSYIDIIYVDNSNKNKGYGTSLMNDICSFADKYKIDLILYPHDGFGSNYKRLINFYYSFGFIPYKNNEMIRKIIK